MADKPVFVLGTPRSGTTLTARILGRHPRIFMSGENHFFEDVYARRRELGEDFDRECVERILERVRTLYGRYNEPGNQESMDRFLSDPDTLKELMGSWKSYRDVLSSVMELLMHDQGKVRWGNNTPRDIFNVDEILAFYPDAKILACVRDVRDFLLSYKGKWRATSPDNVDRLKDLYHPVVTSLLWKSSMRLIPGLRKKVPAENFLIVPYERLVKEPESMIRSACEVIEEDFDPGMLDVGTYGSSHQSGSKGIFTTSVGRWEKQLGPEEAHMAQLIAKNELSGLGYELHRLKTNPLKVLWIFASSPFALVRGLRANRGRRGPMLPYLARRIGSMLKRQ